MNGLHAWELDAIRTLQEHQGALVVEAMRLVTALGEREFYLLLFPLLFWCVSAGVGIRVAVLFLLSAALNFVVKDLASLPRPIGYDPRVGLVSTAGYGAAESYGLPSNHAQSSVVVWGAIAGLARRAAVWGIAGAFILLLGPSRVSLGVHFPSDVLAGWALGAVVLLLYLRLRTPVEGWLLGAGVRVQVVISVAVPVMLALLAPGRDVLAPLGALAGLGVGLAVLYRYVPFSVSGPWWQRVLRFLVGCVVLFALFAGLRPLVPEVGLLAEPLYFAVYASLGLWIALGAPLLFRLMRLAPRTRVAVSPEAGRRPAETARASQA